VAAHSDGGGYRRQLVHSVNRTLLPAARFIAKAMFVRDGVRCSQLSLWTAPGIAKVMAQRRHGVVRCHCGRRLALRRRWHSGDTA
jgi:hypothetical protein